MKLVFSEFQAVPWFILSTVHFSNRMVYNYKRKSDRGKWSEEGMKKAIEVVLKGEMGYMLAAKSFSVPQTTLERKVKKARENENKIEKLKVPLGPILPVFSKKEEDELVDYLLDMESRFFGLTTKNLKQMVYQLSVRNNKTSPFNSEKAEAGKDWLNHFLTRHPELSIRKPEKTSAARAAGFNRVVVTNFFNFLANVYNEHNLTPDRIYNCDETGVSVVPKTRSKILARKGRKQVGAIVSAERGTTITVEICFSATGHYMPPMMVFPRKRMNPELMLNAVPGSWGVCTDSGWMTSERFLEWFKKFVVFSGASVDRPVLLLLDGHSTHTQNIDLINEARANGVTILCFPPHTTHRLQPADVVFMRPLSIFYDQAVSTWLRTNPGMVVTVRQVAELFGKAFIQAATMSTAINGFKTTGIWPLDSSVFSDSDFVASLTTEIPFVQNISSTPLISSTTVDNVIAPTTTTTTSTAVIVTSPPPTTVVTTHTTEITTNLNVSPSPGCSYWPNPLQDQSNFTLVSPKQLIPFPVTKKTLRVTRRRGRTAIITSSPYKQELEDSIKKKCDTEKLKKQNKEIRQRTKEIKQKLLKTKFSKKCDPKKRVRQSSSEESNIETENTPCLFCSGLYLDSKEGWIACSSCGKWSHCGCAGVDDDDAEATFICEFCFSK